MRPGLEMHATQGPTLDVLRRGMLNEARFQAVLAKLTLTECARKPSAAVADWLRLDQPGAVQFGLGEQHSARGLRRQHCKPRAFNTGFALMAQSFDAKNSGYF